MDNKTNEMHAMLCLSTAHLSKQAEEFLKHECANPDEAKLVVYQKDLFGYFLPVSEQAINNQEIPGSLRDCLSHAKNHGADWLMLDGDGPVIDALPRHNW